MDFNHLRALLNAAKNKVTTYLALAVVALSQVAEHVEDIYATVPSLESYLPKSTYVHTGIHYAMSVLGVAVVVARVRRMVWPKKDP